MTDEHTVTIHKRHKALSVGPLKASATLGAALAIQGFQEAIPMLHGSQGCTAFGKIFLIQHFREAIPLQTTALDQITTIMGSDDAVMEGLQTIINKHHPKLIGIPTTALVETQGADVNRVVRCFRDQFPELAASVTIVPISAPDYKGCLESGYAAAVTALLNHCVPAAETAGTKPGRRQRQVNILAGVQLTPGDLEWLKETLERFRLRPVVVPDLGDALDGHLSDLDYSPLTLGGTPVSELATLGDACATIVIGSALYDAADLLKERTGVPDYRFAHVMGIEAVDQFLMTLATISAEPVPEPFTRQRSQLQDAMLDTHFAFGMTRCAIAGDPEMVVSFSQLLASMGAQTVTAVASSYSPVLQQVAATSVKIGDFEDLEDLAAAAHADILITNSHGQASANRLGIPLLRAGFPQFDLIGGYQRCWSGYQGTRQTLFDLANMMLSTEQGHIHPYHSSLRPTLKTAVDQLQPA
jgi:nitrogenase molybdenum-iron cofactor biosynthesis protein NifN